MAGLIQVSDRLGPDSAQALMTASKAVSVVMR
jgi:hypothetical protein